MNNLPKAFPSKRSFQNLKTFQSNPITYMKEAAKWGSPVDLNLPMGDFVLISNPDQAQHVLATNHQNYQKSKGYKEVARVLGQGLLTAEGDFWHQQRKMIQPSFHKTALKQLLPIIWETGHTYVSSYSKEKLRLDTEMNGLTLTVLLNSLINYQSPEIHTAMSKNVEFAQEFIVNRIRTPVKWPLWVPSRTHRRYHSMMKEIDTIIQKYVDDRVNSDHQISDILSELMTHLDPSQKFEQIRDELMTFLVAGHETSALAMTWTIHLLAHNPKVQEKLYQEVGIIKTLDQMDMTNFSNLKYLHYVIMESMRLYPPIWNIVRRATQADTVGRISIPKGKQLMINILLLHQHPEYWKNPSQFRSERFAEGELRHKFQYLPFGAGPRFCIGNNFALYELFILLTHMVRSFEFKPASPQSIDFNPLLTLRPKEAVHVELIRR